jgi:cytochrome c peroxidase
MHPHRLLIATLALAAACGATADTPTGAAAGSTTGSTTTTPTPPSTAVPLVGVANAHQAATVGVALDYDATLGGTAFTNPRGGALRYSATFAPNANGLSFVNGHVLGTPLSTQVVTVTLTATDTAGGRAAQSFGVATFAAGLTLPTFTTAFSYTDASLALPAHFTVVTPPPPPGPPGTPPPPPSIATTDNTAGNAVTNAGATLGRVLFHDVRLSANDRVACASCHIQQFGFSDSAQFSHGFQGGLTGRHSMGLSNARYYQRGRFFWDERAATLEDQVLQPIQNTTEMGLTLADLKVKLAASSYYPGLFTAAFGSSAITDQRIALALAQFVRAMSSYQSKYDQAIASGNPASVLTSDEEAGRLLFTGPAGCARCHVTDAQVMDAPHNDGLDAVTIDTGAGQGRFKSPSLRNVATRVRFMHDGRFTTLAQVVGHYNTGIQPNVDLDPRLRGPGGQPQRLGLSPVQVQQIVAFMNTLTDNAHLTAAKFKTPF